MSHVKDVDPGEYVVTQVRSGPGDFHCGFFRAPDGRLRALALSTDEYHRVRGLLKQGHEAVRVVRNP
jgi:hypothetical protein